MITIIDDILRGPVNGLEEHPANRRMLRGLISPICRRLRVRVAELEPEARNVIASTIMRELGLPCGPMGWAQAWDGYPTSNIEQVISRYIPEGSIVLGWGLPNLMLRSFKAIYFDLELSPIRFGPNFFWSVRTNARGIDRLIDAHKVPDEELEAAASELIAFHQRRGNTSLINPGARCLVFFGQSPIDAALVNRTGFSSIDDYIDNISEKVQSFDFVIFKQHPYGTKDALRSLNRIVNAKLSTFPPYQILSCEDCHHVISLSSSICWEAAYFGVAATNLSMHPRYSVVNAGENFRNEICVRSGFLLNAVSALYGGGGGRGGYCDFDLRQIIASVWGDRFAHS